MPTSRAIRAFRRRRARVDWARLFRRARAWTWRGYRALRAAHPAIQVVAVVAVLLVVWSAANLIYQVIRKPTLMLSPVSGVLMKMPAETWRQYGPLFEEYSTAAISAELLAALAQVEGSGNPVPQTYWRWRLSWNPFAMYRPASSAVGMYQITDGTFEAARRYCIRDHEVVEDGPWYDLRSCWFNSLYTRVLPGHAIELTSAHLDRSVASALARHHAAATAREMQDLAAIIHLCGAGAGNAYVRRGFHAAAGERCGDHDVAGYLARVNGMKRAFARLASDG
jgi:hypothetical protein